MSSTPTAPGDYRVVYAHATITTLRVPPFGLAHQLRTVFFECGLRGLLEMVTELSPEGVEVDWVVSPAMGPDRIHLEVKVGFVGDIPPHRDAWVGTTLRDFLRDALQFTHYLSPSVVIEPHQLPTNPPDGSPG